MEYARKKNVRPEKLIGGPNKKTRPKIESCTWHGKVDQQPPKKKERVLHNRPTICS